MIVVVKGRMHYAFFLHPVEMSELFANVFHSYVIRPVKELGHGSLPGTSDLSN